jgi:undecaprenyl-diphosphatase
MIGDVDRDILDYIHGDMNNKFLDATAPVIQMMGDPHVYFATCALLCAFGNERMFETGKLSSAAFIESGFIAYALKKIVGRPRPPNYNLKETDSFPSGHVVLAFTIATVAGNQYPKLRAPLYIMAFGTAFSRVYLGRHYPSDVIAGAIIGTLVGVHATYLKGTILNISF